MVEFGLDNEAKQCSCNSKVKVGVVRERMLIEARVRKWFFSL